MTSIAEDPSLPLDLDGTSNQLSGGSSQYGGHLDSTSHDATSISSELEQPGTFRNLTSAGRVSPHRTRTMKDQESQLAEYKKENFGLKLRIYHLEQALGKNWDKDDGWRLNIELQVQLDSQKKELSEKDALLLQAKSAIDSMAARHEAHIQQMQQRTSQPTQTEMRELEERVADREAELAEAERELDEANARLGELQATNDDLSADLQEKDDDLGRMRRELDDLQQAIAERDAAAKMVPPVRPTRSAHVQTTEPLVAQLDNIQAQLEAAQAQLQDKDKAIVELQTAVGGKDRRVKELELELLVSSQKMAAGASDYAAQMHDQAAEMDRCKANLREAEAQAKRRGAELEELRRQLEEARRRAREAEGVAGDLQPQLGQKDREIQDLRRQLQEAQTQAREDGQAHERETQGLRRRLRDAEAAAEQSQPQLAAKHREIQELDHALQEKDEEVSRLRSQLTEKEEALARARKSTHTANMEKQEQSAAIQRLQEELEALREQLRQQHSSAQADLEAALAAKDAIISQLRRELGDLQAKLGEIDEKLLELTTGKATELGVLRGELEDLAKQLERQEGLVRALRNKITQLTGEKATLEQQLAGLREANQELQEQLEVLQSELTSKAQKLRQAEQTIANLQKIIEDLQKAQPQMSELEKTSADLAQLRSQMAALEHALRNKEAEADSLLQTLQLKDNTIRELQAQLQRLRGEKARAEERGRELEGEKNELEAEVARLQSQSRVSRLSSDDLQDKLTQAFGEREELARRLKQAQEALKEKGSAYDQARAACEALQEQIKQLQQQLEELGRQKSADASAHPQDDGASVTVTHHETSTETGQPSASAQPQPPGSSSTTMIFSSLSENLLLTILQRLQELYAETTAGRADSNVASSSMSTRLEHITDLQHQLHSVLHGSKPPEAKPSSANTSYTAYYFMRGEDESSGSETSPKRSSTPKMKRTPRHTPQKSPDLGAAPRDASQQISALQSELEEVKRWNEALQARLDQSGRTRDVGVGMEKDSESRIPSTAVPQVTGFAPERYLELEREVDRLLYELEAEKERSQVEKEQQQRGFAELQAKLEEAEEKVGSLEQQLRLAMSHDAATSSDALAAESLREEVERLGRELGEARGTVAGLKGRFQAESDDNRRLRAALAELRAVSIGTMTTPPMETKSTLAASESLSAMPSLLLTPEQTPVAVADSWTSPPYGVSTGMGAGGEPVDVRALRERHEEVTRLNQELQRKCREQLKKSPPQSRPGSGGHSTLHWQAKLREQEEALRSEMLERERGLLGQLRESEARLIEREGEWSARETALCQQLADLEARLGESQRSGDGLRSKLAQALATCRSKDEEIQNLSLGLSRAREKAEALEQQIDQLLAEKNAVVQDFESQVRMLEKEIQLANEKAQRLSQALHVLGSARGEGEGEGDGGEGDEEMGTLQEALDSLSQQLTGALEELEDLKRQNMSLEEERGLLRDQLAGCQDQIGTLQEELTLYQNLLRDNVQEQREAAAAGTQAGGDPSGASPGRPGFSLTAEKVLQLLEEVRKLREQLDSSIRSNSLLAEQLRSRLAEQEAAHTTTTSETHVYTSGASPATKTKGSQTTSRSPRTRARGRDGQLGSAKLTADRGTSPSYIHVSEKSTSTRAPTSEKDTSTPHVPQTEHPKSSSSTFRSERTSTHYRHRDTTRPPAPRGGSPLGTTRPPAPRGGSPLGSSLSYTDVHLSDSSASSFSQPPSTSKPKAGETVSTSTATFATFTSPKDTSTPHARGGAARSTGSKGRFTSTASDTQKGSQSQLFSDGIHGDRVNRVTYHSRGVNTDIPKRSRSDEFLTKGPTLDSSSASSFYSHTTTTRHKGGPSTGDLGTSSSSHTWRRPASTGSHGATPGAPPTSHATPLSSLLHGAGGFESLETRLQQALDSSTLPASDRAFLEELLVYLRQQRRQLDESRRLLEKLERQQQQTGVPATSHIRVETAESGTIPVITTTTYTTHGGPARPSSGTAAATGKEAKGSDGTQHKGTKVDLSSLYEQLLRTHASLVEAKSTLNHSKAQ